MQWDILSNGNPVNAVAQISTGVLPSICVSIIKPLVTSESNMVMLKESSIDEVGGMLIYAPMDFPILSSVIEGMDTAHVAILPSGFVISSDGRSDNVIGSSTSGSLLTFALQVLVCSGTSSDELIMESVVNVHSIINSTTQRIKVALEIRD